MKTVKDTADLKTVLFEPVAPYFADAYNTLSSVVQALALGVMGYEIAKLFFETNSADLNWAIIQSPATGNLLLAFMLICLLWHRYIVHNQFYAWEIGVGDTVIPITFGLLEVLLILSADKSVFYSSFFMACISTWGVVAYINTIQKHNDPPEMPKALILYRKHFASSHPGFADSLFWEVASFEKRAQKELIASTVVMWAITASIHFIQIAFVAQAEIKSSA